MGGRSRGFNTGTACHTASAGCGAAPHGFDFTVRFCMRVEPLDGQRQGRFEWAVFGQDGVADASEFIGQGHYSDIHVSALL